MYFNHNQTGILIIDLQEKLIPAIHEGAKVVRQVRRLVEFAQLLQLPVLVTEQLPQKLGPTVPELRTIESWPIPLSKSTFSAAPILPGSLPKFLLVVGVETHVCIRQTVFDLTQKKQDLCIVGDAVGSRNPIDHDLALSEMRSLGIRIASLEAIAFEMLGSAEHPLFRSALAIFK